MRSKVVAVVAVISFITAGAAFAAGPKGQRPVKAGVHAQKGGAKGGPQSAKNPVAKGHAGKKNTDTATGTSGRVKADKAETSIAGSIEKNPKLETRIKSMLPADLTIAQASEGFRNQGQFIAAVNASRQHDIPFADLKKEMTGDNALSLGQAIQKLRPTTESDPD